MKILISIVSYREKELLNTVKSFYYDAANKEDLLFSIVSQDDEHPDLSFIAPECLNYHQIHLELTGQGMLLKKVFLTLTTIYN